MGEEIMLISDILEEVDLIFVLEKSSSNAMDYGISPTLVVEPSRAVEVVKELCVRLASPEVHVSDFKITPEMA